MRKTLTDTIKEVVPDSPNKRWCYKNATDLVYLVALGGTTRYLKQAKGLGRKDNLRDFLNSEELAKVKKIESAVQSFLNVGFSVKEIKDILARRFVA